MQSFETIVFLLFSSILVYASVIDIKTKTVPTHIYVLLFPIAIANFTLANIIHSAIAFVSLLIFAVALKGFGGGDIKLIALLTLIVGGRASLIGLLIALILSVVVVVIYRLFKKQTLTTSFAFVPFISIGYIIAYLIKFYI